MNVALYARYSTEKQDARSIDDQLRRCRAFASGRGWTIATDDNAALTALGAMYRQDYPYVRIRKLLIRDADEGLVAPS